SQHRRFRHAGGDPHRGRAGPGTAVQGCRWRDRAGRPAGRYRPGDRRRRVWGADLCDRRRAVLGPGPAGLRGTRAGPRGLGCVREEAPHPAMAAPRSSAIPAFSMICGLLAFAGMAAAEPPKPPAAEDAANLATVTVPRAQELDAETRCLALAVYWEA